MTRWRSSALASCSGRGKDSFFKEVRLGPQQTRPCAPCTDAQRCPRARVRRRMSLAYRWWLPDGSPDPRTSGHKQAFHLLQIDATAASVIDSFIMCRRVAACLQTSAATAGPIFTTRLMWLISGCRTSRATVHRHASLKTAPIALSRHSGDSMCRTAAARTREPTCTSRRQGS